MRKLFPLLLFMGVLYSSADTLLINPGFENWIAIEEHFIPVGWFTSAFSMPGSADRTTHSHTGNYGLKLMGSDTIAFATTATVISENFTYLFTGWAKSSSPLGGMFLLNWLNQDMSQIGNPVILPITLSTDYKKYSKRCQVPDSAAFIVVSILAMPRDTVYIDDVNLESIPQGIEEEISLRGWNLNIHPNPFKAVTSIKWLVTDDGPISLEVYDVTGRLVKTLVKTQSLKPGTYTLSWDGKDNRGKPLPARGYFIKLETEGSTLVKEMILIR